MRAQHLKYLLGIVLFFAGFEICGQSIRLNKKDALVWHWQQTISGMSEQISTDSISIHHDDSVIRIKPDQSGNFSFSLTLGDGKNHIWAEAIYQTNKILSDTLTLTLGYKPLPLVVPFAYVKNDTAILTQKIIENPRRTSLRFSWYADDHNPAPSEIIVRNDSSAWVRIPAQAGDYYFKLLVVSANDSTWFRTYISRKGKALTAFDIDADHASWIDDAILYQITPHSFVQGGTYDDIRLKLSELKTLGINTIYLQPVYRTFRGGQGYDVIDYFSLRPDLGSESQLRALIDSAKALDLRVLFDFIPNHTSIHHPYADSVKKSGAASHYYHFYQHEPDGMKYASAYNQDADGFIYYFWKDLVNLNYDNEEVQRWMIEACKYWVREFGIDGYRFDAVWGVNARMPSFGRRLRLELKSMKPDIFLLAEDKPGQEVYTCGFDAAYDWTQDTSWVSSWSWQYEYHEKDSRTIFNFPQPEKRAEMLRQAIFHNGISEKPRLRFMENNDLPRFGVHHDTAQVKMVAALLLSLPGIPLLYNGQEVGIKAHPYSRHPVFVEDQSIRSLNPELFDYYRKLLSTRQKYSALHGDSIEPISVAGSAFVFAFRRSHGNQNFIILINLGETEAAVKLDPVKIHAYKLRQAHNVITGEKIRLRKSDTIAVKGYTTSWLLLE